MAAKEEMYVCRYVHTPCTSTLYMTISPCHIAAASAHTPLFGRYSAWQVDCGCCMYVCMKSLLDHVSHTTQPHVESPTLPGPHVSTPLDDPICAHSGIHDRPLAGQPPTTYTIRHSSRRKRLTLHTTYGAPPAVAPLSRSGAAEIPRCRFLLSRGYISQRHASVPFCFFLSSFPSRCSAPFLETCVGLVAGWPAPKSPSSLSYARTHTFPRACAASSRAGRRAGSDSNAVAVQRPDRPAGGLGASCPCECVRQTQALCLAAHAAHQCGGPVAMGGREDAVGGWMGGWMDGRSQARRHLTSRSFRGGRGGDEGFQAAQCSATLSNGRETIAATHSSGLDWAERLAVQLRLVGRRSTIRTVWAWTGGRRCRSGTTFSGDSSCARKGV